MSELTFAKTFLQTLDSKANKYPSNHVFDPKTFATRIPFTLPKLPQPPHPPFPKSAPAAPPPPGATPIQPRISLVLKSSRNPALTVELSDIDPSTTTIAQLRESVQNELGGPSLLAIDKIKILYNKKPIPVHKKTLGDIFESEDWKGRKSVELTVMIIGGAPDPPARSTKSLSSSAAPPGLEQAAETPAQTPAPPPPESMEGIEVSSTPPPSAVQGPGGKEILETGAFWIDLQAFLEERLKDEAQAAELSRKWKNSWKTE